MVAVALVAVDLMFHAVLLPLIDAVYRAHLAINNFSESSSNPFHVTQYFSNDMVFLHRISSSVVLGLHAFAMRFESLFIAVCTTSHWAILFQQEMPQGDSNNVTPLASIQRFICRPMPRDPPHNSVTLRSWRATQTSLYHLSSKLLLHELLVCTVFMRLQVGLQISVPYPTILAPRQTCGGTGCATGYEPRNSTRRSVPIAT